jgi:hypothetical protein
MATREKRANGNGAAITPKHDAQNEENIFLFIPNLIGS